jgi:hypothetical protein
MDIPHAATDERRDLGLRSQDVRTQDRPWRTFIDPFQREWHSDPPHMR